MNCAKLWAVVCGFCWFLVDVSEPWLAVGCRWWFRTAPHRAMPRTTGQEVQAHACTNKNPSVWFTINSEPLHFSSVLTSSALLYWDFRLLFFQGEKLTWVLAHLWSWPTKSSWCHQVRVSVQVLVLVLGRGPAAARWTWRRCCSGWSVWRGRRRRWGRSVMEDAAPWWSAKVLQTGWRHLASSVSTAARRTVLLQPATRCLQFCTECKKGRTWSRHQAFSSSTAAT